MKLVYRHIKDRLRHYSAIVFLTIATIFCFASCTTVKEYQKKNLMIPNESRKQETENRNLTSIFREEIGANAGKSGGGFGCTNHTLP